MRPMLPVFGLALSVCLSAPVPAMSGEGPDMARTAACEALVARELSEDEDACRRNEGAYLEAAARAVSAMAPGYAAYSLQLSETVSARASLPEPAPHSALDHTISMMEAAISGPAEIFPAHGKVIRLDHLVLVDQVALGGGLAVRYFDRSSVRELSFGLDEGVFSAWREIIPACHVLYTAALPCSGSAMIEMKELADGYRFPMVVALAIDPLSEAQARDVLSAILLDRSGRRYDEATRYQAMSEALETLMK